MVIRTLLLITVILFSIQAKSSYTNKLSEDQTFIVPSDAPKGEYVGHIKAYPEYMKIGEAVAFQLQSDNSLYALSSEGLITIAENSALLPGIDTLQVTVKKAGYSSTLIAVAITVINHENCIYVDASLTDNSGNGTRSTPFKEVPPLTDGATLLFKRGTTYHRDNGPLYIQNLDNILIASYGSGPKPLLTSGDNYLFRFYSSNPNDGGINCTIRDLEVSSPEELITSPDDNYQSWMNAICYTSNQKGIFSILHNTIHHTHNGITINTSSGTSGESVSIKWNTIYEVAQEGIYLQEIRGKAEVVGNHIEKVNLLWSYDQQESVSSGDGIQTYDVDTVFIKSNYIDRSFTGNKFNIIAQYNHNETTGSEWVEIVDNYLIGNAGGPNGTLSGALIYADFAYGRISRNHFIGQDNNIGIAGANSTAFCKYSYNIFKECGDAITDPKAQIYNSIFYGCKRATARSENSFKNNIIFFTDTGQMSYSVHLSCDADYNLYNREQKGMFGTVDSTLGTVQPQKESNSIVASPDLENIAELQCKPLETSPVVGQGIDVGEEYDFEYVTLSTPPNIGIHEQSYTEEAIHKISLPGKEKLHVRYNRAKKVLYFSNLKQFQDSRVTYTLFTPSGRVLESGTLWEKSQSISLSMLPTGLYFCKLKGAEVSTVVTCVIHH